MMRHLALLLLLLPHTMHAQGADGVESFHPGSGQSNGQEAPYFPSNVLGLPDTAARATVASVDPIQICSIGLGGEITLRFDRTTIVDAPGADFTVFENAFLYTIGGRERVYAEPAEVAVSRDGITFLAFPFDSLTLEGCAGITPTNGDRDPFDPQVSGGDSFDLAALGIDSVRWVRLRDVTSIVRDNRAHPLWDPTLSGFDLDAVVAIPRAVATAPLSLAARDAHARIVGANPASDRSVLLVHLPASASLRVRLVATSGAISPLLDAARSAGDVVLPIDVAALPSGAYRMQVEVDGRLLPSLLLGVIR